MPAGAFIDKGNIVHFSRSNNRNEIHRLLKIKLTRRYIPKGIGFETLKYKIDLL